MRRTRDGAMRHKALALGTRDRRPRFTPTKNRHAALHPQPGATRAYQSDSSSKQPAGSIECSRSKMSAFAEKEEEGEAHVVTKNYA